MIAYNSVKCLIFHSSHWNLVVTDEDHHISSLESNATPWTYLPISLVKKVSHIYLCILVILLSVYIQITPLFHCLTLCLHFNRCLSGHIIRLDFSVDIFAPSFSKADRSTSYDGHRPSFLLYSWNLH